ncbi:angiopoietin-related protein 1a [Callorhinchus milii]|uniref:Angiopoietin-like 1a n=2 Tax=Callorhinchus milii TaxID=7868 RepID=A0A4W3H3E0_CALMI|nr:angiopoietin-related protein 1a [Callorhinchus milii]|eukprot:gi/632969570/ref/XP_007901156.1/ PREDICTED: angiopoietin-related protein 1 [Callorhinchus milii]
MSSFTASEIHVTFPKTSVQILGNFTSDCGTLLQHTYKARNQKNPIGDQRLPLRFLLANMNSLIWTLCLLLISLVSAGGKREQLHSRTNIAAHTVVHNRYRRSPESGKCSYTFLVPQQRITGPICVSSKGPETDYNGITKMDVEELKDIMSKQKRQIENLQLIVEVDGGIVNEVKLLRKESRNMNSRVTQLYMQLLHEIIRKRDNSLEISQLENKVLNSTAEILRMATRYRELEQKYAVLSALVNNQSLIISRLEDQCIRSLAPRDYHPPPLVQVVPQTIPRRGRYQSNLHGSNEIQRDQNPAYSQERAVRLRPPLPEPSPTTAGVMESPVTEDMEGPWKDCYHVWQAGYANSGMYLIKPSGTDEIMQVWCDHGHDQGGWTVIQRRMDGAVNFFRNWENYKKGFGNIDGEHWLGLEKIHRLTVQGNYKLYIKLEDWNDKKVYAEYTSFRVEDEGDYYRLRVGSYQGTAGDSLIWHNGKQFTTLDRDRDLYSGNCAHFHKGGWWYNACAHSNLNGVWYRGGHYRSKYQDGVYWAEFRGGSYSLKSAVMMVKPE